MDLEALRIFLKVAEVRSLTRAGEHLGLSKAHVSRKLLALESDLDTRLFHRSTRVVRLTQDGEALLPRAKNLLRDADDVGAMFRGARRIRGRVRIDLPVNLACRFVLPALPELLDRHPDLELLMSTTDRFVDVVGDGFDCVLRVGTPKDTELTQRKLGELALVNCVSSGYAERHGIPRALEDLDRHYLVHYAMTLGSEAPMFEYEHADKTHLHPMSCLVTVNAADAYRAACLAGLGIIQVPRLGIGEALARGTAVEVLGDFRPRPMPVVFLHAHGRRLPQRVRTVMDFVAETLRGHLM